MDSGIAFLLLLILLKMPSTPSPSWSGRTIFDPPKPPITPRERARRWGVVAWMVTLFVVLPCVFVHYRGGTPYVAARRVEGRG